VTNQQPSQEELQSLAADIVDENRWPEPVTGIEFLPKGYSTDKKFLLRVDGSPRYLLRMSDPQWEQRRRSEFDMLGPLERHGVVAPRPVSFGKTRDGSYCFMVVTYVDGVAGEEALPALGPQQQYEIGLAAGCELRKIHELPTCGDEFDMASFCRRRVADNVQAARELGLSFDGQERIEQYVDENVHEASGCATTIVHNDYHPGNLIVRDAQFAGVIDFNRSMRADPYWDFYKIPLLTCFVSEPFARGQIHGYFDGQPEDTFWPRYNLYVAASLHISLVWPYQNDRAHLGLWQDRIQQILHTHDFNSHGPPQWYLRGEPAVNAAGQATL